MVTTSFHENVLDPEKARVGGSFIEITSISLEKKYGWSNDDGLSLRSRVDINSPIKYILLVSHG